MRYFVMVLVGLGLSSLASAEQVGTRYYRNGGSAVYSAPYYTQQQYNTNSNYAGGHGNGSSRFNNQWQVGRRYQVDAWGRPIASGSMGTAGSAERGYLHNNNPATLQSIEQREEAIQHEHREYLDQTQRNYSHITQNQIQNAQLQNDNSARAREIRQSNDQFNDTFRRLNNINRMMHQSEMNGTAGWLPPVR